MVKCGFCPKDVNLRVGVNGEKLSGYNVVCSPMCLQSLTAYLAFAVTCPGNVHATLSDLNFCEYFGCKKLVHFDLNRRSGEIKLSRFCSRKHRDAKPRDEGSESSTS